MKQLLFPLVLISASFACNAMEKSDEEKFHELKNQDYITKITRTMVNESLVDNEFARSNPQELVAYALEIKRYYLFMIDTYVDLLKTSLQIEIKTVMLEETKEKVEALLAQYRIMELAHEYGEGAKGFKKLNVDELKVKNDVLEQLFLKRLKSEPENSKESNKSFIGSITSNVFLLKGAGITALIVAAYLGWSYRKNTKKAK